MLYYCIPRTNVHGGYYGLVVVTPRPPPHPQIDIGERIAGKQDGPSVIIYGPSSTPPPPPNSQKCNKNHIGAHI